ncbi:hypothetical protein CDD83_5268 [Cordyceps sp. RAO-2017]|nr:hypothetical protein CDD83_5268 [Cordyceps sp. RAO-2017]
MEERRKPQNMPRHERCSECGSRKWYLQDGLRFCSRGHQIEGFIQFDISEDKESGRLGVVSRREKEIRDSEKRHLTGADGKALYLEAVQLLLRNQVVWLIKQKGCRKEIETVVQDMWDLRIRGSSSSYPEDDGAPQKQTETFSSLSPPAKATTSWKRRSRADFWNSERGADWPMPRLPETLALCYVGSQLLRTPLRHGELLDWANNGCMPYKTIFHDLPREMQDRMPSAYQKALKLPLGSRLRGAELSKTVLELTLSYHLNYSIAFPDVCHVPLLIEFARLLALPAESVITTKRLTVLLNSRFSFPTNKGKILLLDHPEIHLVTLLVIATKLCFPLKDKPIILDGNNASFLPSLDWKSWKHVTSLSSNDRVPIRARVNFNKTTPSQLVHTDDDDFEAHVTRVLSCGGAQRNENAIGHFFTTASLPELAPAVPEPSEERDHGNTCQPLGGTPESHLEVGATGRSAAQSHEYEAFRSVEDLTDIAAEFYSAAGNVVGISTHLMVRAVYAQEQKMISWQKMRRGSRR